MVKYRIGEKPDFAVTDIGVKLKSSSTDFAGLAAEKQTLEQKVIGNGTIGALKQATENHYFFTVNEPHNRKMMYYVGVQTSQDVSNTTRIILFTKGTYLAMGVLVESLEELRNDLTNTVSGHVLREVEDYAHVGGSNVIVETGVTNEKYTGRVWVPVVSKP